MVKTNKPRITFNYQKADKYKNYHIDGVYGGLLPTGNIWFDVFIEKGLVPDCSIFEVDGETGRSNEIESSPDTKNKLLRELQSGFTMSLSTAKIVKEWLDEKIRAAETFEQKTINKAK